MPSAPSASGIPAGSVLDLQVYYLLATVYARLGETDLARKYAELSRTTTRMPRPTAQLKRPGGHVPPGPLDESYVRASSGRSA